MLFGSSPRLGEGKRADLGNLPIHDAREFVHDHAIGRFTNQPCEVASELLAIGQDGIRAEPCWNGSKPDGRKRAGHLVKVVPTNGVHDWLVVRPLWRIDELIPTKDGFPDRRFAGSARTNHKPELPIQRVNRKFDVPRKVRARLDVEKRLHTRRAVAVVIGTLVANLKFHVTTTLQLYPWSLSAL